LKNLPIFRQNYRFLIVQLSFIIIMLIISFKVLQIQYINPLSMPILSSGEYLTVIHSEVSRGKIYDSNGNLVADNKPLYLVQITPAELPSNNEDLESTLDSISTAIGISKGQILEMLESKKKLDPYTPISIHQTLSSYEAINIKWKTSPIDSINIISVPQRIYFEGTLYSHILGHTGPLDSSELKEYISAGYPQNSRIGKTGIELIYENQLRGKPSRRISRMSATGKELTELVRLDGHNGTDLILTIKSDLQKITQTALLKAMEDGLETSLQRPKPNSSAGAAVALDIETGDILAQVSLPTFDINTMSSNNENSINQLLNDPLQPLIDRTYMDSHPPGSVFKTLVAYAALEEGIATPNTKITSTGALTIRDQYNPEVTYVFRDWAAHGTTDLYWGLARSSDVYFYYLAGGYKSNGIVEFEGLGSEKLAEYSRYAGFGKDTNIDLPGETSGLVPDPTWKQHHHGEPWYLGDTYTYGIGQGYLTVTPLQMAVWTAAIANDGKIIQPRLVKQTISAGIKKDVPVVINDNLENTKGSLAIVREAMRVAASPGGTARRATPNSIEIGGKTGTAEFGPKFDDNEYDSHAWYIGFAPFDKPEIAVAVYVKYGNGSQQGADVAHEIFQHYFQSKRLSQ